MRGKQLEGGHIDVDTRPNAEKAADALRAQGGEDSQKADAPQAGEDSGTGKEGTE